MTIFRKVFDNKKSAEVPDYFERVATPEDVSAEIASAQSQPLPATSQPAPTMIEAEPFGIGHAEPAPPDPSPSLAEMAADACERMQSAPLTAEEQATGQGKTSSMRRNVLGATECASPTSQPNHSAGNARTRLLGFHRSNPLTFDPLDGIDQPPAIATETLFPAGWVAITDGPGKGNALPVFSRVCLIGRGEDQDLRLDFGDTSISRDKHAAIAFDDEQCKFYLGHGGKSNMVRLNGRPVLSTEELTHGDIIRIGETTLRFVALCGTDFTWDDNTHDLG